MPMRVTMEPTEKMVEVETKTGTVEGRVWQGQTMKGVPFHAIIVSIGVEEGREEFEYEEFETELKRTAEPRADVKAIPAKYVI